MLVYMFIMFMELIRTTATKKKIERRFEKKEESACKTD